MLSFLILSDKQLKYHLKSKLSHNWMVLTGINKPLIRVEHACFPPGSQSNNLFHMVINPFFPYGGFALCKKTNRLKRFCNVLDFEETLAIVFVKNTHSGKGIELFRTEQVLIHPQYGKDEAVDLFVSRFWSWCMRFKKERVIE